MRRIVTMLALLVGSAAFFGMAAPDTAYAETSHTHGMAAADTLWVCPMNDTEPKQQPGDCPTCGMHLVAQVIDPDGNDITPDDVIYTCPMHPEVVQERPGTCPKCGMFLTMTTQTERPDYSPMAEPEHQHRQEAAPAAPMDDSMEMSAPITKYKCPMHPDFIRDEPGSCGICGMDLVPFTIDPNARHSMVPGKATVTMDEAQRQRIGVRTAPVERRTVERDIRTVGRVVPDERGVTHIHTKYAGWVERLFVDFTGERVRAGDPVLEIYSPELVAAQQEYLVAFRSGQTSLSEVGRRRLKLLDMTDAQIRELQRSGEPRTRFTIYAPHDGTVIAKNVSAGHQVTASTTLYAIADLSRVWVLADAYETDLPLLHTGLDATVSIPSTGMSREGTITFVSPVVDVMSRTAPVRVELSNSRGNLRPGAFVDVALRVPLGERTVIPREGILDTGERKIVFVETEPGRFEPREVTTGVRTDGLIEVVSGVEEGEEIVTSATFFIDSESQLQAAINAAVSASSGKSDQPAGHQH